MHTRISKIARLPAAIREQLNLRLHNGELGRTILPWVNNLAKTKKILAGLFNSRPITHQNLSEWRATGYQDWLFHQQRLVWFSRLKEEDHETSKHDRCGDTYEAMSRFFVFEIGQAMQAAQKIKNPDARWEKMERLADKFARLQNSYNWSRRVQLEFDKYNNQFETDEPEEDTLPSHEPPDDADNALENGDRARPGRSEPRPRGSHLRSTSPNSLVPPHASEVRREPHRTAAEAAALPGNTDQPPDPPESPVAEISPQAPHTSEPEAEPQPASVLDCGNPLPLSELRSSNSDLPIPKCHPIPTPAPTTPTHTSNTRVIEETNTIRKTRNLYTRTRGRGFIGVDG